jgi:hypothetical protein
MLTTPDRQTFRALVADVAARAKAILPTQVNGRVEKAVALVLQGDVEPPAADGSITVYSATDPTRRYVLQGTSCTCADFERGQAPEGWCCHRIAAGIQKRVQEILPRSTPVETEPAPAPQALPEAPASVNCHLTIAGRQVQLTLRDVDEGRLLVRLEAVLARFPLPPAEASSQRTEQGQGWCAKHQVQMQENHKDGRSWWSHRTAEGWCKGK